VRDPELFVGGSTRKGKEARRRALRKRSNQKRSTIRDEYEFQPFDDTRIHPEHFYVAIKVARDARADDGSSTAARDDSEHASLELVLSTLEDPKVLDELDLLQYALYLQSLPNRGLMWFILQMVREEYRNPFADPRIVNDENATMYRLINPCDDKVFYTICGADSSIIHPGALVTAAQCRVSNNATGINCSVFENIQGFIEKKYVIDNPQPKRAQNGYENADEHQVEEISDADLRRFVATHESVAARICSIDTKKLFVELSCRNSDIRNPELLMLEMNEKPPTLPDYVARYPDEHHENSMGMGSLTVGGSGSLSAATVAARGQGGFGRPRRSMVSSRVRSHMFYKEAESKEDVEHLMKIAFGPEIVIWAGRTPGDVRVSFGYGEEDNKKTHIVHLAFKEGVKEPNAPPTYRYENREYEDLDEFLEECVRPWFICLKSAAKQRKFVKGGEEILQKELLKQKQQGGPKCIPYGIAYSQFPGMLALFHIPGSKTVKKEVIKIVLPNKYKFRDTVHPSLDHLFAWLKHNFREHRQPPPTSLNAPRTPGGPRTPGRPLTPARPGTPGRPMTPSRFAGAVPISVMNTMRPKTPTRPVTPSRPMAPTIPFSYPAAPNPQNVVNMYAQAAAATAAPTQGGYSGISYSADGGSGPINSMVNNVRQQGMMLPNNMNQEYMLRQAVNAVQPREMSYAGGVHPSGMDSYYNAAPTMTGTQHMNQSTGSFAVNPPPPTGNDPSVPPWRGRQPVPAWANEQSGIPNRMQQPSQNRTSSGAPMWRGQAPVPAWMQNQQQGPPLSTQPPPPPPPPVNMSQAPSSDGQAPSWRGQAPVPAWKQQQMQQQQQR